MMLGVFQTVPRKRKIISDGVPLERFLPVTFTHQDSDDVGSVSSYSNSSSGDLSYALLNIESDVADWIIGGAVVKLLQEGSGSVNQDILSALCTTKEVGHRRHHVMKHDDWSDEDKFNDFSERVLSAVEQFTAAHHLGTLPRRYDLVRIAEAVVYRVLKESLNSAHDTYQQQMYITMLIGAAKRRGAAIQARHVMPNESVAYYTGIANAWWMFLGFVSSVFTTMMNPYLSEGMLIGINFLIAWVTAYLSAALAVQPLGKINNNKIISNQHTEVHQRLTPFLRALDQDQKKALLENIEEELTVLKTKFFVDMLGWQFANTIVSLILMATHHPLNFTTEVFLLALISGLGSAFVLTNYVDMLNKRNFESDYAKKSDELPESKRDYSPFEVATDNWNNEVTTSRFYRHQFYGLFAATFFTGTQWSLLSSVGSLLIANMYRGDMSPAYIVVLIFMISLIRRLCSFNFTQFLRNDLHPTTDYQSLFGIPESQWLSQRNLETQNTFSICGLIILNGFAHGIVKIHSCLSGMPLLNTSKSLAETDFSHYCKSTQGIAARLYSDLFPCAVDERKNSYVAAQIDKCYQPDSVVQKG